MSLAKIKYKTQGMQPLWDEAQLQVICQKFNEVFDEYLEDEHFILKAETDNFQVQVCMNLCKEDGSIQYPVQCICPDYAILKMQPTEVAIKVFEYLNTYWKEYFEDDRDTLLTIDWAYHKSSDLSLFIRGWERNVLLEMEANKLLAASGFSEYANPFDESDWHI